MFDSLIHLQDSQTVNLFEFPVVKFDSLIHLQDSQTEYRMYRKKQSLIHLFTYKTLKLIINLTDHLFV